MENPKVKIGYVVEGARAGYFYNRVGQWTKYSSAAEGYVWSDQEVAAIRDAAASGAPKWEVDPEKAHAALYDDTTGVTVITSPGVAIRDLKLANSAGAIVPLTGGLIFDLQRMTVRLTGNRVVAAAASL